MVEDVTTALREAGNVRLVLDKALRVADLVGMRDLVTGRVRPDPGRP